MKHECKYECNSIIQRIRMQEIKDCFNFLANIYIISYYNHAKYNTFHETLFA